MLNNIKALVKDDYPITYWGVKDVRAAPSLSKKHGIVDADGIIYPIGFIPDITEGTARRLVRQQIETLCSRYEPMRDTVVFLFTSKSEGGEKYRDQFHKTIPYKHRRRKAAVAPRFIDEMKAEIARFVDVWEVPAEIGEADDGAMMQAREAVLVDDRLPVIHHTDKDLNQIPGMHVPLRDPSESCAYVVSDATALRFFYAQLLAGDSADDIPGCPGVGSKTAVDIVANTPANPYDLFERTLDRYTKALLRREKDETFIEEFLYENAQLLYLRQHEKDAWVVPTSFDSEHFLRAD